MNDLVTLTLLGVRVVLVHGGGPAINEMLKKVGVESHFANGLRVTDDATMEIVQQVLAGYGAERTRYIVAAASKCGMGMRVFPHRIEDGRILCEQFKTSMRMGMTKRCITPICNLIPG